MTDDKQQQVAQVPLATKRQPLGSRPRPVVLMILDGLGIAPDSEGNAVTRSKMPNFQRFIKRYPTITLKASGESVGLLWGEMGNSEVGHLTIGTGRINYMALPRIEKSIKDGDFFENVAFLKAIQQVKNTGGTLHIMGVMSSGKVHGYNMHAYALLELAKKYKVKDVAMHVFLDGRDTLYNSGIEFVTELEQKMKDVGVGRIATISGRYFAMDRDNRWDRVEKAYNSMVLGSATVVSESATDAIRASYQKEVYDEEFVPTVITKNGKPLATVKEGDAMIFFNYRADRARQITKAFTLPSFDKFKRTYIQNLVFVTMMQYEKNLPVHVAYPQIDIKNSLSEVLSEAGMVQLHIAETEKYAHVTFFFNGAKEVPFPHEDRVIIPSPKVSSYDQKPEMSAKELTEKLLRDIRTGNYDFIVVNYANPDMVAHTGNFDATVKSHEAVDLYAGMVVEEVLKQNGVVLLTADHGNSEELINLQTGEIDKEHSTNPVPFITIGNQFEGRPGLSGDIPNGDLSLLPPVGMLADIAPTILKLLGIEQPVEMTGAPLVD
ncbi:2,3-bisphosphoglycerate-independent phosphoglycerate mutase [Patescibacteria group bacterium]|nr:2,3-bisphosphoglycerate-independent phosphoglycerate mutase [Patescibacteria group bacterium]